MPRNSFRSRRYASTRLRITDKQRSAVRSRYLTKRKLRSARTGTRIGKTLGFPKTLLFKHKYVENVLVTATAGALATYTWKCNSLYDPNETAGGHQPLYYDQLATLYNHYTVIGSKIRITMADADTTADSVPCYAGIFLNDDNSVAGLTYISIQEQSLGKSALTVCDSRQTNKGFNYTWSAKKTFGGSVLANTSLTAAIGADPTELSYYTAWFAPADGASTVVKYFRAEIEYIAVWHELKDIPLN